MQQKVNPSFDSDTYKRLKFISPVKPLYSDVLLNYLTLLEPVSFINSPQYTVSYGIKPKLSAINESRFSNFNLITSSIKKFNQLYTIDLKPHKIYIYGNNISPSFIYHVANIVSWWEKIKPQQYIIYLYLTDLKKEFPQSSSLSLTEISINSGFTFIQKPNDIHIFRKEECLKVLLHELIHASNYDFSNSNLDNLPIKLRDDNITNEGITEYFAIIHYDWYLASFLKDSVYKNTSLSELFLDLLSKELYWQEYQINKIFKFFNMQPNDLLNDHNNFSQKTSALSYYVFKHFLFTQNSLPILLSRNYDDINSLISKFSDYIKNFNSQSKLLNHSSLRMSLFELNFS
jgi:hypothetical protein